MLHGSLTVEHSADNGKVVGSIPACAIRDDKRIGKQSVLKTDAPQGVAGSSPCIVRQIFEAARIRPLAAGSLLQKMREVIHAEYMIWTTYEKR